MLEQSVRQKRTQAARGEVAPAKPEPTEANAPIVERQEIKEDPPTTAASTDRSHEPLESADTNGVVAIFEFTVPVGAKVPLPHSHKHYDETVYGVEGVVTFAVEGRPGESCFVPRGAVQGFNNPKQTDVKALAIGFNSSCRFHAVEPLVVVGCLAVLELKRPVERRVGADRRPIHQVVGAFDDPGFSE